MSARRKSTRRVTIATTAGMNGKERSPRLRKAVFDVDYPAAAALAIIGRTPLAGALTGAKPALAGTLNQTLAMILHEYLLLLSKLNLFRDFHYLLFLCRTIIQSCRPIASIA